MDKQALVSEHYELGKEIEALTQSIEQEAEAIKRTGHILEEKKTVKEIVDIDPHLMHLIVTDQMKKDIAKYKEVSKRRAEVDRLLNS